MTNLYEPLGPLQSGGPPPAPQMSEPKKANAPPTPTQPTPNPNNNSSTQDARNTLASAPRQPPPGIGGIAPGALSPRGNKPKKFGVKTTEEEPSALLKQKLTATLDSNQNHTNKAKEPFTKPAKICLAIAIVILILSLIGAVAAGVCLGFGVQIPK
ncbi:hypothetical protein M3Y94_01189500 [Aphelenchoides besseyi]|nr:hypothetical protein M3Y94_01189500 [Aphelenchoides besseyi]KAI6228327.1 hypothetical protein M3Y95_00610800 [Aphelenchoides besseyi]